MTIAIGAAVFEVAPALSDYEPRGGLVVGVSERANYDTGEVVASYEVVHAPGGQLGFFTLTADRVSADVTPVNRRSMWQWIRRCAKELAAANARSERERKLARVISLLDRELGA